MRRFVAGVAQLEVQRFCKALIAGSSPAASFLRYVCVFEVYLGVTMESMIRCYNDKTFMA